MGTQVRKFPRDGELTEVFKSLEYIYCMRWVANFLYRGLNDFVRERFKEVLAEVMEGHHRHLLDGRANLRCKVIEVSSSDCG